ncbi:MAG: adenylate kinase [Xanthomonadales bacterium]|nr:adenylate kinase [Xanthomonadales bacterium]
MRIVMLGAPGSGKGTQAKLLSEELNIPHISTGELLRAAVSAGTELGLQVKEIMASGQLVSDDIMLGLIEERLGHEDARKGFLLDGYPRNLVQAKALDELLSRMGMPVEEAIDIAVDNEQIIERISKRAELENRSDDTEAVVRRRLQIYAEQTAPVSAHYSQQGILTQVLGVGSIEEVYSRISAALKQADAPAS